MRFDMEWANLQWTGASRFKCRTAAGRLGISCGWSRAWVTHEVVRAGLYGAAGTGRRRANGKEQAAEAFGARSAESAQPARLCRGSRVR